MEFNSSCDQTNFMGYYPPSQISNGGLEYYQEITDPEHSKPWKYASKPQDELENHMGYFPPPQNDSSHYSNGGWEYHQEIANSEHSNPWKFALEPQINQTKHMRYCPEPQIDLYHYPHEQEILFKKVDEHLEKIRKHSELLSKEDEDQLVDVKEEVEEQEEEASVSSKLSMKNEVVEEVEPETALKMTREHENSQPSQTFLN
ncbi:hypothetical protein AHAS_Ahas07G0150700 [Arachis hypogaea]